MEDGIVSRPSLKVPFLAVPPSLLNDSLPKKENITMWKHGLPLALLYGVESGALSCLCPSREHVAQVCLKDCSSTHTAIFQNPTANQRYMVTRHVSQSDADSMLSLRPERLAAQGRRYERKWYLSTATSFLRENHSGRLFPQSTHSLGKFRSWIREAECRAPFPMTSEAKGPETS